MNLKFYRANLKAFYSDAINNLCCSWASSAYFEQPFGLPHQAVSVFAEPSAAGSLLSGYPSVSTLSCESVSASESSPPSSFLWHFPLLLEPWFSVVAGVFFFLLKGPMITSFFPHFAQTPSSQAHVKEFCERVLQCLLWAFNSLFRLWQWFVFPVFYTPFKSFFVALTYSIMKSCIDFLGLNTLIKFVIFEGECILVLLRPELEPHCHAGNSLPNLLTSVQPLC